MDGRLQIRWLGRCACRPAPPPPKALQPAGPPCLLQKQRPRSGRAYCHASPRLVPPRPALLRKLGKAAALTSTPSN